MFFTYKSVQALMSLKILIIGSGGREHAIAWLISKSKRQVDKIYVMPGNAGTITEKNVFNIDIDINNKDEVLNFAIENTIDLTIVGPEVPLVDGISDLFERNNLNIFGPKKYFEQLEGSKVFSKKFMQDNNLPTADYKEFDDVEKAVGYVKSKKPPIVVKYDGLAAGKGVDICESQDHAESSIKNLLKPNESIIVEDFIKGIELSSIYICNPNASKKTIGLPWVKDYKSRDEYNSGPNTGGMGAITHPYCSFKKNDVYSLNTEIEKIIIKTIVSINNSSGDQSNYNGFLYLGLMISTEDNKPYLLEYNCRMGDPETQVVLSRLKNDFVDILTSCENQTLDKIDFHFDMKTYTNVVLASGGYPEKYEKGKLITGLDNVSESTIFHAGTIKKDKNIYTIGGRVLSIVSSAPKMKEALRKSYNTISKIDFEGKTFRKDIGFDL